ncbi:YidC/Oxa1 family membrane protein insertase [Kitasatospora sp. NPDC096147]|uniref:YidC/Oxa1 family membrane protein insertase n=1 Tax=Kitasatospora sp. NPDC096147 TaxID=3364093 RepID=UPI00382DE440
MSVFTLLDPVVGLAHDAVAALAAHLPTALAIVLFTVAVRLLLHPLARSAARGERVRVRLAPQLAELGRRHEGRPERLREATAELYRREGGSPFAGCLPMLAQLPFFTVMYRLFTTPNDLLGATLFGVPLGLHPGSAHSGPELALFAAVFAALTALGWLGFRRARRTVAAQPGPAAPGAGIAPYLSYGTALFAVVLPLAGALYLLTTTAWTLAERAWLQRGTDPTAGAGATPTTAGLTTTGSTTTGATTAGARKARPRRTESTKSRSLTARKASTARGTRKARRTRKAKA